jgi:hypothetical protein
MAANPNTFPRKTVWSKMFQLNRYKACVYPVIAHMELRAELEDATSVKRTYSSNISTGKMGDNGSYVTRARTNTEEQIDIDQKDYVAAQFPSWDKLLWNMDNNKQFAQDATGAIHTQTDANILGVVRAGAGTTMDESTIDSSGTSGEGITVSIGNIDSVFSKANTLLRLKNVDVPMNVPYTGNVKVDASRKKKVAIIDPDTAGVLDLRVAGRETPMGDDISNEGFVRRYMGWNVFVSNNLPYQAVLLMATNPTDEDTVVIGGVTFTFDADLGTDAGNVHIASTVDITRANFAAALAAPYTSVAEATDTGFVALTATQVDTDAKKLIFGNPADGADAQVNISAANDNDANTLTITILGVNKVTVSETLTAAADVWVSNKQTTSCLFVISDCVDLIMKRDPNMEMNYVNGQVAKDFIFWDLYGRKVFHDQSPKIVNVKVDCANNTAPTQTFA